MKAMDLPWVAVARETAGARKAALVLYGLGTEDRGWVMSCLPLTQREVLEPLLAELKALGLPVDRALADELLGASHTAGVSAKQEPSGLAQANAAHLAEVLVEEPVGLIAALLSAGSWRWKAELMGALPLPRRRQVEAALHTAAATQEIQPAGRRSALQAELVLEIRNRLSRMAPEPPSVQIVTRLGNRLIGALRRSVA